MQRNGCLIEHPWTIYCSSIWVAVDSWNRPWCLCRRQPWLQQNLEQQHPRMHESSRDFRDKPWFLHRSTRPWAGCDHKVPPRAKSVKLSTLVERERYIYIYIKSKQCRNVASWNRLGEKSHGDAIRVCLPSISKPWRTNLSKEGNGQRQTGRTNSQDHPGTWTVSC